MDNKLKIYLDSIIKNIFIILPLYERNNEGLESYIHSFVFQLNGWNDDVEEAVYAEYKALLNTLKELNKEVVREDSSHAVVRREVFKGIDIVKDIISKLENGEAYERLS